MSFNPLKIKDTCEDTEEFPSNKYANFHESDYAAVWDTFGLEMDPIVTGKINPYRADYIAMHSIKPKYLGNFKCTDNPCHSSDCPYIPEEMKSYRNQFGENKLVLSTDGQHQCAITGQNTHPMDGEILQTLMNMTLPDGIAKGPNFEYDLDAEGMQGFEKMKNVCSRKDTNVIADIRANCLEDGPVCATGPHRLKCASGNTKDIDIIWTSINADGCTVTANGSFWKDGFHGAFTYSLKQEKTTFTLDCLKDNVLSSDKVIVYCKDEGACPNTAP